MIEVQKFIDGKATEEEIRPLYVAYVQTYAKPPGPLFT